ncbi:YceI family protein [Chryseolinea soli]|uniref:YceI family protein n=1 Tax=Chryseolinea soli TaxID=2321403 RepID=A0A385SJ30_9BACT|nr:YceI family protein [Chryseolinea soli]AYB29935.1 YceI family protein [Chryseolinea soli]
MKRLRITFLILTILALLTAFTVIVGHWNIDPNYSIKFSGSKAEGTFSGLKGTIIFDPSDLAASNMDVSVDANTIKTGNDTKNKHARGESWLDVAKYPIIRFTSSSFSKSSDKIIVTGTLTLHGVKKQIQIPFTFNNTGDKSTFVGDFKINRHDYAIEGNMFGFAVGDEFDITLRIPVSRNK